METTFEVIEQSQVAQVRRHVVELARAHGLSDEDMGRAALVATEMSTNLVKYGKKGSVTVSAYADEGSVGVQIIAVDDGPGFADFNASSRDGHSTGGSLGIGLGVIMRAADIFDSYTPPAHGSAFLARVARDRVPPGASNARLAIGARRAPKRGETECGDDWAHASAGRWERLCVADGLGHGPLAAVASAAAIAAFLEAGEHDTPLEILQRCHVAMRHTRGAVMAIVAIEQQASRLLFAGVGNIAGLLSSKAGSSHLLSNEGIVGHHIRSLQVVEKSWSVGDSLVLSSDGLLGRWNLSRYPGLLLHHPGLVASVLFRDFGRDTDDATVVVAKDLR